MQTLEFEVVRLICGGIDIHKNPLSLRSVLPTL